MFSESATCAGNAAVDGCGSSNTATRKTVVVQVDATVDERDSASGVVGRTVSRRRRTMKLSRFEPSPLIVIREEGVGSLDTDEEEIRHHNLLYFDFKARRLLPSSVFPDCMCFGSAAGAGPRAAHPDAGNALSAHESLASGPGPIRRKDVWAQHGQPMHFLTLEFEDTAVELEFQHDAMRRTKRWVEYATIMSAITNLALSGWALYLDLVATLVTAVPGGLPRVPGSSSSETRIAHGCLLEPSTPRNFVLSILYLLQYCHLRRDRDFVLRHFQEVLLFWSMLQATVALICAEASEDAEYADFVCLELVLITLIAHRLRFFYFLMYSIYLLAGFMLIVVMENALAVLVMCCGALFLSYSVEVLQRSDFVQASTAWREHRRSNLLLLNVLPPPIVAQLKAARGQHAIAQSFRMVTVLFADVVSFTTMSALITPGQLVKLLNRMFRRMDALAEKNGVEKIKTIGDCYMAAAGLPLANPAHAQVMARFGLQLVDLLAKGVLTNPATGQPIQVRAGIHSGPCVAGVIGHRKFAYDIWGDAVNTASRMESHGEAMRLHCSDDSYELIKNDFVCEARDPIQVKGKGVMQTYFVVRDLASDR